jgi:hypothetical protein
VEEFVNYVRPELMIVAIVLYFLGLWLKQAAFLKDKYIPLALGAIGIFICGLWVASVHQFEDAQAAFAGVFAAVTQGILVAGLSTYVNQIIKQLNKAE